MINNFEEQTKPLNDSEERAIPYLVRLLKRENVLTSGRIIEYLKRKMRVDFAGPSIRKMIHHIRVKGLVPNLLASGKGYFVENDPKKVKSYITRLRHRVAAINEVADSYRIAA